ERVLRLAAMRAPPPERVATMERAPQAPYGRAGLLAQAIRSWRANSCRLPCVAGSTAVQRPAGDAVDDGQGELVTVTAAGSERDARAVVVEGAVHADALTQHPHAAALVSLAL